MWGFDHCIFALFRQPAGPFIGLILSRVVAPARDWWRFGIPFKAVILLCASLQNHILPCLPRSNSTIRSPLLCPILLANLGRIAWIGVVGGFMYLGLGIGLDRLGTWLPEQWSPHGMC